MAIPNLESLLLPLLQQVKIHGQQHVRFYIDVLGEALALTDAELNEVLPSGKQHRFANRVNWAASYLARAGLLERPVRGQIAITPKGQQILTTAPEKLTVDWLDAQVKVIGPEPEPVSRINPEEALANTYAALRRLLASELLDRVKQSSPAFFEQLVVDLLVAMGYGGSLHDAGRAVGRTGDGGIDGIIKEDKLGLDFIYLQAKRWENVVGRPVVQAFAGSLHGFNAQKGVMITTSTFSKEARDYATQIAMRIVLIDGQELAQLMIDHGVGVATVTTYAVKRVDAEYFEG